MKQKLGLLAASVALASTAVVLSPVPASAAGGTASATFTFGGQPKVTATLNQGTGFFCVTVLNAYASAHARVYVNGTTLNSGVDYGGDDQRTCNLYAPNAFPASGYLVAYFTNNVGTDYQAYAPYSLS